MHMRHRTFCVPGLVLAILAAGSVCSAAELFSNSTDTISVAGNPVGSTQVTYEATVEFNSTSYSGPSGGWIFNAWQFGSQEESMGIVNGGIIQSYAYDLNSTALQSSLSSVTTGTWYDLAYVYDGSQERLYIDGTLEASRSASGNIRSGNSVTSAVGAIFRDGFTNPSFLGEIQSLRISDVARYFGNSYANTTYGDFSDDSSTLLLYDFDSAPTGNTITDLSGNGHTGTLGTGFQGATSPTFAVRVPEPASAGILVVTIGVGLLRRRRVQRM
jgi:hypothetical protein